MHSFFFIIHLRKDINGTIFIKDVPFLNIYIKSNKLGSFPVNRSQMWNKQLLLLDD